MHDLGVMALVGGLTRNITPPPEHGVEGADHPNAEKNGAASTMWCIHVIAPTAVTNSEIEPIAGHGLGSTRW